MVDGCFFHGCPQHGSIPKSNVEFWSKKIRANRARDKRINFMLELLGWNVFRFWECEVMRNANYYAATVAGGL